MRHWRAIVRQVSVWLLLSLTGCAGLDTQVQAPARPLPGRFERQDGEASVGDVEWRRYFSDPLLQALIESAVANNLDLQVAMQRIELARNGIRSANAALLPQVNLAISGGVRKFGLYTMDGAGNASTFIRPGEIVPVNLNDIFLGLQSSWEVDIWGKLRSQKQAAIASYLSSIEGTNFVISNLVADVATIYNELLSMDNELRIVRQTIQRQEDALSVVRWQKEAGRATEVAVQQFSAQLLGSKALRKALVQQITETENRFNLLLGRYPQPIRRSRDDFFALLPDDLAAGLPSRMLANRPDLRQAELQVKASGFDVKTAKAAFFPNFTITGTLGFQAFDPEFLFTSPASLAYSLMGNVITPLVNRAALKAQFNAAKANQLTAMFNYQKAVLTAYSEVSTNLANIRNLRELAGFKREQSRILERSVEMSKELYKSGRASYLEVLTAQQNALQANLELVQTLKQQRLARVAIYKALGGGWR